MLQTEHIADSIGSVFNAQSNIFGANSEFSAHFLERTTPILESLGWTPSWQYTIIVMCFIVLLLVLFYRYSSSIRLLLSNFISVPATQSMLESATVEFNDFLRYSRLLSFLGLSLVLTGIFYHIVSTAESLFYILMVVSIGVLISFTLSVGVRKFITLFDYSRGRLSAISSVYSLDVLVFSLFFALPIFAFLSVPIAQLALILLLSLFYFLHIVKIFYIFRQQRFSFLQTFLYLCTVEIAPFTLSWGIMTEYKIL